MEKNQAMDLGQKPKRPSFSEFLSSITKAGPLHEVSLTAAEKLAILDLVTEGVYLQVAKDHPHGEGLASFTLSKEGQARLVDGAVAAKAWGDEKRKLAEKFAKDAIKRQINYVRCFPVLKSVEIYRADLEAEAGRMKR